MSSKRERPQLSLFRCRLVAIAVVSIGMLGCGSFRELSMELDGSRDATFSFWCRLQGIQYKENAQIVSQGKANLAFARGYDVDQVANGFASLAAKHDLAARQLEALGSENADPVAVDYRDRLVALHKALHEQWTQQATAAKERDEQKLTERDTLFSKMSEYVELWSQRYAVMATLKSKYDWDFDCAE